MICPQVKLGLAGGDNLRTRRPPGRGADWVLLLNNDALAEDGLVAALEHAAAARPDAGVLACKVLVAGSGKVWYAGASFDPILGRSRHAGFGGEDEPGELRDVARATGTGMAGARAAIER